MIASSAEPSEGSGAADASCGDSASLPTGPTIWGLKPADLHDHFWASRGVQVVRCGDGAELSTRVPLFLLIEPQALVIFDSSDAQQDFRGHETPSGSAPQLLYVRIHDVRQRGPRERVITDSQDRFVGFQRLYNRPHTRLARAAITRDRSVAATWQTSATCNDGWRTLRRTVPKNRRWTMQSDGMLYDKSKEADIALLVRDLTHIWQHPHATIERASQLSPGIWKDRTAAVQPGARLIGPVWIGSGRQADASATVVGPAVLWDNPSARPAPPPIRWDKSPWLSTTQLPLPDLRESVSLDDAAHAFAPPRRFYGLLKRAFDILFSLAALCLTLPLYVPIAIAIAIEDGWPILFIHRRETLRGKEFPCVKFRSMRRDAEQIKDQIRTHNEADGPQFFMARDPRLTKTGRFIRKFRLDELPQFFNVLVGHMSVVGPRPSPFKENQYCPAWREIRLSVRPGITGLWQVMRTRAPGADFQEWIRYDIEYVENAGWKLDLLIIWKTIVSVLRGDDPHRKPAQKPS